MSTLSLSKLKSYLPFSSTDYATHRQKSTKRFLDKFDPEVGFHLTLCPKPRSDSNSDKHAVPELHVNIIGARHLPSIFGLKSVEGYVIKVKLFPGSTRYDTSIQTSSWPTFNETFKFPMETTTKSSFKSKTKHIAPTSSHVLTLPEKLFKGHFLVLTVFALLELPAGHRSSIKNRIAQIRRKSSLLRNLDSTDKRNSSGTASSTGTDDDKDIMKLTTSETRRNIGSVTCFLDPKIFTENLRTLNYTTEEIWMPIKDITVTPSQSSTVSVTSCPKGQIEMILHICTNAESPGNSGDTSKRPSQSSRDETGAAATATTSSAASTTDTWSRWSISDVKKKLSSVSKRDKYKGLCLKIVTSKMRCSIKVKEEFENVEGPIYVKTTVFERDILSSTWKSDQFAPSLSIRWNVEHSTIIIPLNDDNDLEHISIKISVATKTKLGKKIVLGTLFLGGKTKDVKLEHWENMVANKGSPVAMWHAFE